MVLKLKHADPDPNGCLEEATLEPRDAGLAGSLVAKGLAFRNNNHLDTAISAFQEAARQDSWDAKPQLLLGETYRIRKQFDLTLEAFSSAIRSDSNNYSAFFNRGLVYLERENRTTGLSSSATRLERPHPVANSLSTSYWTVRPDLRYAALS